MNSKDLSGYKLSVIGYRYGRCTLIPESRGLGRGIFLSQDYFLKWRC